MSRKGDRKAVHISWSLPGQVSGTGQVLGVFLIQLIILSVDQLVIQQTLLRIIPLPTCSALGPGMDAVKNPRRTKKWSLNSQNSQASNRGNTCVRVHESLTSSDGRDCFDSHESPTVPILQMCVQTHMPSCQ